MNANACEVNSCKHTPGHKHSGINMSQFTVNMLLFFYLFSCDFTVFLLLLHSKCETHIT